MIQRGHCKNVRFFTVFYWNNINAGNHDFNALTCMNRHLITLVFYEFFY